jgi:hypothetical protein
MRRATSRSARSARGGEFGRVCVNVDTVYRSRDARHRSPDVVEQFRRMAAMESAR